MKKHNSLGVIVILISMYNQCSVNCQEDSDASECEMEEADYHNLGSYSHSAKCNRSPDKGKGRATRDVEETIVKRAIYRSNLGHSPVIPKEISYQDHDLFPETVSLAAPARTEVYESHGENKDPYIQLTETITKYRQGECVCPTIDQAPLMTYIRQIIASLLNQMDVQSHNFGPGETITIDLQGEISYSSYMDLTLFLSVLDGEGHKQLQTVSDIMSNLLHTVHTHQQFESIGLGFMFEKLQFHLPMLTTPKFWLNLFSLSVTAFLTILLGCMILRARDSPPKLFAYTALLFFVFSCVWIYAEKHENAKAENAARLSQFDSIPRDCDYNNFTRWELLTYYFRVKLAGYDDQCVQYYQESSIDPFYRNTPVEAISEAATRMVFHPLGYIGGKLGDFMNALTRAVPFWMRPFVLMFVFVFIFFSLFPYRIRTPLLSIEPASYPQRPLQGPPPEIGNGRGMIVPLHRLDAATDTDDLEEYIRQQEEMAQRQEAARNVAPPIPSLNFTPSWFTRLCTRIYSHLQSICDLLLHYLRIILCDVPIVPEPDERVRADEVDIWHEHHPERDLDLIDPEPEEIPVPVVPLNVNPVNRPNSPGLPSTSRQSLSVDGNSTCGIDEGFPVDFDESILMFDDELLEGEVINIQLSRRVSSEEEGQSSRLDFHGVFETSQAPSSSTAQS